MSKRYEIICNTAEIKSKKDIKELCTRDQTWQDPVTEESFDNKEDALKALEKYSCTVQKMSRYYLVTEYYIEENEYNGDEWVSGGDIIDVAKQKESDPGYNTLIFANEMFDLDSSYDRKQLHKSIGLMFNRNRVEPLNSSDEYDWLDNEQARAELFKREQDISKVQIALNDNVQNAISDMLPASTVSDCINALCDSLDEHNNRDIEGILSDERFLFEDLYGLKLHRAKPKQMLSVKSLRQRAGMSLVKFSEYFGVPYRTVQNWDAGINQCPEYLLKLMEYKLIKERRI